MRNIEQHLACLPNDGRLELSESTVSFGNEDPGVDRRDLGVSIVPSKPDVPQTAQITTQRFTDMDELVRKEFYGQHFDEIPNLFRFRKIMFDTYPHFNKELKPVLKKFIKERTHASCEGFKKDERGNFLDPDAVLKHLREMRPELDLSSSVKLYEEIRVRNIAAAKAARPTATTPAKTTSVQKSQSVPPPPEPSDSQTQTVQQPLTLQHVKSAETTQTDSPAPPAHSPQINGLLNAPPTPDTSGVDTFATGDDILAKKLKQLQFSTEKKQSKAQTSGPPSAQRTGPDFNATGKLVKIREARADISAPSSAVERSIRQAPLLAASIVAEHYKNLVPQYGLLGSLEEEDDTPDDSQLFLNTNVPFSAFICGVQGSGKSHTTSCILENAIIASSHLGHLESPVSTLVFSYGEWSSGGAGFNISESTFLGASHTGFPDHHVKKVTVLYSPSNPAIKRMYERLPNVQMLPFRLKAKTLDIGVLHTLMAVDEKSTMPLYMATVEAILRDIASKSADCSLDYLEFKRRLAKEKFDQTQTNMLKMRMNLLESFLDLDGTAPVPDFNQGEVTIIDLSDPFLTPSTACILFKLGLEQFLQSSAPGKMVVLDEAHKYMLNTSGAKILTDYLTRVIRLQRHQGARVVISTQEPTIATDLIALCSVIIMHRFTSPTWYAALKKHINAVEDDWNIMQRIEAFDTGEALVYSPNAVLGRHEDGSLIKATGKLMRVNVRNRVTLDGGASIMAV